MKFKVLVTTPSGTIQHIIHANSADQARHRAALAQPKAEMIQVFEMGREAAA